MNIVKIAWVDYLVTYLIFILMLSCGKAVSPMFYLPAILLGYYSHYIHHKHSTLVDE
ncbi:hypothetical protein DFP78_106157 [Photobacterium lutimaris]|nr:hypothetical protein DFP78_106157 [Photobacterium lutimaris]